MKKTNPNTNIRRREILFYLKAQTPCLTTGHIAHLWNVHHRTANRDIHALFNEGKIVKRLVNFKGLRTVIALNEKELDKYIQQVFTKKEQIHLCK